MAAPGSLSSFPERIGGELAYRRQFAIEDQVAPFLGAPVSWGNRPSSAVRHVIEIARPSRGNAHRRFVGRRKLRPTDRRRQKITSKWVLFFSLELGTPRTDVEGEFSSLHEIIGCPDL